MVPAITDEYMMHMRTTTKNYTLMILKSGPRFTILDVNKIIWEHARKNFSLRAGGLLTIVCPVSDETEIKGAGIFNADLETVRDIMEEDPGVREGVFVYELHPCRSFPGDILP
jgi:hypothetical protein